MSEINELTKTLNAYIKETSQRHTRLETIVESLANNMSDLSNTLKESVKANIKLESKLESLEDRAINRIDLVEDTVNEVSAKVDIVEKQVHALELINANKQGVELANEKNYQRWFSSWQKMGIALTLIIAIATFVFQFFINTGATP